jgi:antitoxin VapB
LGEEVDGMANTAKIFMNGRSQAVRLPSEFRFKGAEVAIRKDLKTGDVILSQTSADWPSFFKLLDEVGPVEKEFLRGVKDPRTAPEDIF